MISLATLYFIILEAVTGGINDFTSYVILYNSRMVAMSQEVYLISLATLYFIILECHRRYK